MEFRGPHVRSAAAPGDVVARSKSIVCGKRLFWAKIDRKEKEMVKRKEKKMDSDPFLIKGLFPHDFDLELRSWCFIPAM